MSVPVPPQGDAPTPPVVAPTPPPPARPAASPPAAVSRFGLDSGGWRPTIAFAVALAVLVFGTQMINAVIPARGAVAGGDGRGVPVSARVTIHPATGWTVGQRFSDIPGLRFQKGGVAFDVRVTTFSEGGPGKLLSSYVRQIILPVATQLDITSTSDAVVSRQYPAFRATYVALFEEVAAPTDGQLTGIVFKDGLAIVFDAWAPQGTLTDALEEVAAMIDTVEIGE